MGKKLLEFNGPVPIDAENIHTAGRNITHAIEASWQARLWARMHAPPYFCRETPVKHRALTASEPQPPAPSSASWPLHLHLQQQSTPVAANTSLAHDYGTSAGTKMPSCAGQARPQNCSSSGRPELEEKPGRRLCWIVRTLGMPSGNVWPVVKVVAYQFQAKCLVIASLNLRPSSSKLSSFPLGLALAVVLRSGHPGGCLSNSCPKSRTRGWKLMKPTPVLPVNRVKYSKSALVQGGAY